MALALDNPGRSKCHKTKKPDQSFTKTNESLRVPGRHYKMNEASLSSHALSLFFCSLSCCEALHYHIAPLWLSSVSTHEGGNSRTVVLQWWWDKRDNLLVAKKAAKKILWSECTCPRSRWNTIIVKKKERLYWRWHLEYWKFCVHFLINCMFQLLNLL